jgi:hypothetical protein
MYIQLKIVKMRIFGFILYVGIMSLLVVLCLPQQTLFRDKVTRQIFEIRIFVQYKNAFLFTKILIWSILVLSCLFFSRILFI